LPALLEPSYPEKKNCRLQKRTFPPTPLLAPALRLRALLDLPVAPKKKGSSGFSTGRRCRCREYHIPVIVSVKNLTFARTNSPFLPHPCRPRCGRSLP
jgi:hypothetical protein